MIETLFFLFFAGAARLKCKISNPYTIKTCALSELVLNPSVLKLATHPFPVHPSYCSLLRSIPPLKASHPLST